MALWNTNPDRNNKNINEKRVTRKNINFYSKCINGEQIIGDENQEKQKNKAESKVITGGFVDEFEFDNFVGMVGADSVFGAKNGVEGAKIACETVKTMMEFYGKVYKTEDRLVNAVSNEKFAKQLNEIWQEIVLAYAEEKTIREKEEQEKERKTINIPIFSRISSNKNKDEKDEENNKPEENCQNQDGINTLQTEEKEIDKNQILKDYATSVSFAIITKNYYLLATTGQCDFTVYNMYEGKKAFENKNGNTTLGNTEDFSLYFEKYSQGIYSSILMMSEKLSCLLPEKNSCCRYAKQVEKTAAKIKEDAFVYVEENGAKNNLEAACKDYGLFVSLAVNNQFRLSPEKESEYKEAALNKTIEEAKKAKELRIQQNLEIAKDKSVYATYENPTYEGYENLKIFAARRQGRSHVDDGSPCQDYCLSAKSDKGVVLAVSDGVGSCSMSDVGSKFACEALIETVKFADEKSSDEEHFVMLLQSVDFRKKVFEKWRNSVIKKVSAEKEGGSVTLNDVFEHAATLLFAVITDNYYVVGNLGDGQILLYNQDEATKIRKHSPKESSKTRSLVNYNGFSETFIVEKYRRSDFSSIILSTDGMYDPLENGDEFYKYAKEAEKRFIEKDEPYQPFCYTVDDEDGYKEIFSSNTYDDCTIILATDTTFDGTNKDLRRKVIEEKYDYTVVESLGDISIYASSKENDTYTTIVSKSLVTQPKIDGIKFFDIVDSYEKDGNFFNVYKYTDAMTINKLYQFAILCEQGETKSRASYLTLKLYEDILECIEILDKNGYALNQHLSHNLIVYTEDKGIMLYPEAIVKKEENKEYDNRRIRAFFDSLYGKLECGDRSYPLFNVDFNNVGGSKYLTQNDDNLNYVGVVRRISDKLYLENCGEKEWYDMEDNPIKKGERILLIEGELFKIKSFVKTYVYSFVEKKNF